MRVGGASRGAAATVVRGRRRERATSMATVAAMILVLGFFLVYPAFLIFIQTFNVSADFLIGAPEWGLDNWRAAFEQPKIWRALGNTLMIWGLTMAVSFPIAVIVAWTLARTNIPASRTLEFMFWVSFMMPGIATTIAWIGLMDPFLGLANKAIALLPFVERGPFNIYSVPGIVWANLMANGVAVKVMLLTPAFRNMDARLEEAARISGATNLQTMLRVTLPVMAAPIVLVLALQSLRIFQSFEIEQLLGVPFGFFVYSTLIFSLVRTQGVPNYPEATVLASATLLFVAAIIPLQRWMLHRRQYTTLTSGFMPGLIDLGRLRILAIGGIWLLVMLLTVFPFVVLVFGSFMNRTGYFTLTPVFTFDHWTAILGDPLFLRGLKTTLLLAIIAAILSPLLFSAIAYVIVRTRWRGRAALDMIIWGSGAIPGMLSSLGLLLVFLTTPGLVILYGTLVPLVIVVILQGNTTGVNITKGVIVQVGSDMEDAARIAGAGWLRTYFLIWIPLLMPTMLLLATMNFVFAAGATSSIILLSTRAAFTLSVMALEVARAAAGNQEEASIIGIFLIVLTVGLATIARRFGLRLGVSHDRRIG